jgi:TonB-dependent starch-binding outer membrane protein SusC
MDFLINYPDYSILTKSKNKLSMREKLYFQRGVLMAVAFLLVSIFTFAQDRRVTGKVLGSDGTGIPGASIQLKGTTTGTTTNASGDFAINVRSGNDILSVSSVGYKSKEVRVGAQSVITVSLEEDVSDLSEVVVTGYASQAKKDVTGAVSTVKAKDLTAVASSSFTQQLQGRAAGVTIGSSGEPGAPVAVRIRGIGTLNNNDPLIIVDGLQIQGPYQTAVNSDDIETIQVLKDAASASIYGSRAGNGVVIITTKKGKSGTPTIEYSTYYGIQSTTKTYQDQLLTPQELGDLTFLQYKNAGAAIPDNLIYGTGSKAALPEYLIPLVPAGGSNPKTDVKFYSRNLGGADFNLITKANKAGTEWYNEVFKPAPIQNHNLSIRGGSEKSTYYLGMNYFNQAGMAIETYFKRYSFIANSEFTIKKNLKVGESMRFAVTDNIGLAGGNQNEGNIITNSLRTPGIVPIYDEGGYFAGSAGAKSNTSNPVAQARRSANNNYLGMNLQGLIFTELSFLKDFKIRSQIGLTYFSGNNRGFGYRTIENTEPNSSNSYFESQDWGYSWRWTNILYYTKKIGTDHNISAYGGIESGEGVGGNLFASRTSYFLDDLNYRTINAGSGGIQNGGGRGSGADWSVFGRAEYSYADKYLLQATVRRDGNSVFGVNNRYALFPAASVGWRVSKEEFMRDVTWVDDLKIRFGWGQSGNSNIPSTLSSNFGQSAGSSAYAIDGGNNSTTPGFAQTSYGNPNLKWETTTTTNLGIDALLLKGKLDVILDIWTRKTTDLLVPDALPGTAGLRNAPYINFGDMQNTGIDLAITHRGNISKLKYEITANLGTYKNTVTRIAENPDVFRSGNADRVGEIARTKAGSPIAEFYGYKIAGLFQNQAEVDKAAPQDGLGGKKIGGFRYVDVNGDNKIDDADRTYIGTPHPDFNYGINIALNYGQFDLTIFFQGVQGGKLYNSQRYWIDFNSFQGNRSKRMLYESWSPTNTNAKLPILDYRDASSGQQSSDYYLEDGSYMRMKNLQLGYTLPAAMAKKIGLDRLRVYAQAQNLLTFTSYTGMDPDLKQRYPSNSSDLILNIDAGNYPLPRILTLGLNVTF